jgi:hypothetical protein
MSMVKASTQRVYNSVDGGTTQTDLRTVHGVACRVGVKAPRQPPGKQFNLLSLPCFLNNYYMPSARGCPSPSTAPKLTSETSRQLHAPWRMHSPAPSKVWFNIEAEEQKTSVWLGSDIPIGEVHHVVVHFVTFSLREILLCRGGSCNAPTIVIAEPDIVNFSFIPLLLLLPRRVISEELGQRCSSIGRCGRTEVSTSTWRAIAMKCTVTCAKNTQ